MLSDFFFVLRVGLITIFVVFLMQLKINGNTLEAHSLSWLHNSTIGKNLQSVVTAGAITAERSYIKFINLFTEKFLAKTKNDFNNIVGNRENKFELKRSSEPATYGEPPETAMPPVTNVN